MTARPGSQAPLPECSGDRKLFFSPGIFVVLLFILSFNPAHGADLRIAYNSDWYPYSYGESGEVRGILVELLDRILSDKLGYALTHSGYPWSRVQLYVEKGREDAFFTFPSEQRLDFSMRAETEVFHVESRIFVRQNSTVANTLAQDPDISNIGNVRVCVMLGDNWSENFYRERDIAFEYGRDTLNCLDQVAHDRSDLFMHATASSLAELNQAGISEQVVMLPQVYSSVPLTLLVSRQTEMPQDLLRRFDEVVRQMEADGTLQTLIDDLRNQNWTPPGSPE